MLVMPRQVDESSEQKGFTLRLSAMGSAPGQGSEGELFVPGESGDGHCSAYAGGV